MDAPSTEISDLIAKIRRSDYALFEHFTTDASKAAGVLACFVQPHAYLLSQHWPSLLEIVWPDIVANEAIQLLCRSNVIRSIGEPSQPYATVNSGNWANQRRRFAAEEPEAYARATQAIYDLAVNVTFQGDTWHEVVDRISRGIYLYRLGRANEARDLITSVMDDSNGRQDSNRRGLVNIMMAEM